VARQVFDVAGSAGKPVVVNFLAAIHPTRVGRL